MQRQRLPDVASAGAGVIHPDSPNVIAAAAYCVEVVRACAYVRAGDHIPTTAPTVTFLRASYVGVSSSRGLRRRA